MPNYQHGKIYSIRSSSCPDLVYVGSTVRPLSERFASHNKPSDKTRSKQLIELGDAYIELIEDYPCENIEQLNRREGQIQRSIECVNRCIAGRTKKEYAQDNKEHIKSRMARYFRDNKDILDVKHKQYYQANKEAIAAHSKQYRQDNKETISARRKQHYQDNRESILTKNKFLYPGNKETIAASMSKYYQANKEAIIFKKSQYYKQKKMMRTCICGKSYNWGVVGDRNSHYRSPKHQNHVKLVYERIRALQSSSD